MAWKIKELGDPSLISHRRRFKSCDIALGYQRETWWIRDLNENKGFDRAKLNTYLFITAERKEERVKCKCGVLIPNHIITAVKLVSATSNWMISESTLGDLLLRLYTQQFIKQMVASPPPIYTQIRQKMEVGGTGIYFKGKKDE